MTLPTREEVIEVGMQVYQYTYYAISIIAVITIIMIVSHLVPRKEY